MTYDVAWCIAGVATFSWAKKVFPKSNDPVKDLWNEIFKLCLVLNFDRLCRKNMVKLCKVQTK